MTYALAYLLTFAVFLAADMVWLSTMVDRLYRPAIGPLMAASVNLPAAAMFYLIYPVGLLIFAVLPGLKAGSIPLAAGFGALFGLFTYATYNLTNLATLRNWPWHLTLADMAWGTVLGAAAAAAGTWLTSMILAR